MFPLFTTFLSKFYKIGKVSKILSYYDLLLCISKKEIEVINILNIG